MNKEEFILNISPANGEPSKEYVMRLNTKLLLENEQLKEKVNQLEEDYKNEVEENLKLSELWRKSQQKVNQLETNRDEAIAYIKHSWRLKFDQVYDTSKDLQGWEVEELLSILERGKE